VRDPRQADLTDADLQAQFERLSRLATGSVSKGVILIRK
jgi:hypothetical protein